MVRGDRSRVTENASRKALLASPRPLPFLAASLPDLPFDFGILSRSTAKMAFTMHSHSGQFCPGHAKDQLEDIIKHAISIGYKTMGLTEHMPRFDLEDLYPEEAS